MGFRGLRLVGLGCPGCARRIRQKDEAIGKAVAWIEEAAWSSISLQRISFFRQPDSRYYRSQ